MNKCVNLASNKKAINVNMMRVLLAHNTFSFFYIIIFWVYFPIVRVSYFYIYIFFIILFYFLFFHFRVFFPSFVCFFN
jgi:hypothetical protein